MYSMEPIKNRPGTHRHEIQELHKRRKIEDILKDALPSSEETETDHLRHRVWLLLSNTPKDSLDIAITLEIEHLEIRFLLLELEDVGKAQKLGNGLWVDPRVD